MPRSAFGRDAATIAQKRVPVNRFSGWIRNCRQRRGHLCALPGEKCSLQARNYPYKVSTSGKGRLERAIRRVARLSDLMAAISFACQKSHTVRAIVNILEESRCMELLDADLDWPHWLERWEAMQNCYVPRRLYRFDLMLTLPHLPREAEVQILDLGCGPGSLSFFALHHYRNARIVAVDFDPVLLAMGQQVAEGTTDRIQFLLADLREAEWWTVYEETFDLVLSATALHWLNAAHFEQTLRCIYRALKGGGWFMNSDHAASDDSETQARYNAMLEQKRAAAFRATKADRWDGFWQELGRELSQAGLPALRNEVESWEGNEDGHPRQFQMTTLEECGFEQVDVYWQEQGEAVIGGRKPLGMRCVR